MIKELSPTDSVLDPCRFKGAFYDKINNENKDWCEIQDGKDFYEHNNDNGSDYIFTANPSIETHKLALKIANKKSFINLFGGVSKNNSKLTIDSNFIHYNEINLTGSHGSSHRQHIKALKMIENKEINLKPLITHKFKLKDIKKAYKVSLSGKALKVSIRPN